MKKYLLLLFFLYCGSLCAIAQTDTLHYITTTDSLNPYFQNSKVQTDTNYTINVSPFDSKNRPAFLDIEVPQIHKNNLIIFVLLTSLLSFITLLKVLFTKDFEELIAVLRNNNIATQIYRSHHQEVSFSSLFLIINFIVVSALMFVLTVNYFHHHEIYFSYTSLVISIFLFTFFITTKVAILKLIGNTFEIQDSVERYLFNYFAVLKTVGIIMIPMVFIWMVSADNVKFFLLILLATLMIAAVVAIAARGLSTSLHLMYKSIYHFLIYICVVEVIPLFLLIKLLTKTAI